VLTSPEAVRVAADRLWAAAALGIPCAPVRDLIGPDDVDTAYAVAALNIKRRIAAGVPGSAGRSD
jgi:2-keto-4-pentenoate hydratase